MYLFSPLPTIIFVHSTVFDISFWQSLLVSHMKNWFNVVVNNIFSDKTRAREILSIMCNENLDLTYILHLTVIVHPLLSDAPTLYT